MFMESMTTAFVNYHLSVPPAEKLQHFQSSLPTDLGQFSPVTLLDRERSVFRYLGVGCVEIMVSVQCSKPTQVFLPFLCVWNNLS